MNRAEVFRRIGRIIKAACPEGTGFAAIIDSHYMASGERDDVARMLAEWLRRRPRVALAQSAVLAGPAQGEEPEAFTARRRLELQCVAIADTVGEAFVGRGHPLTMAFFLFEIAKPGSHMAYRIIGSEATALAWVAAIAALRSTN